ncbi:MFS transporter, PPP family, 3-phenylpropionic acid transporter [Belnapia rosea]|uniref:MFS transporter, PPP family, 3-phenylpropionic acid transporter n=1 Tax=Belnapia rosea TaxID=938405 RepID=A0A1G7DZF0_9PROT|nr:MFS transporter, PPP family, 3-phenylpropionic acid transporter [Belnapia rosea]
MLFLVRVVHALATAPVGPLPDALAVRAAAEPGRRGLDYGVVRGAGAAAFIAASTAAGWLVAAAGSPHVVTWLNAGCFALTAGSAVLLPRPAASGQERGPGPAPMRVLLRLPAFCRLLLVSGLVQGSHAFYAGFAVLGWQAAGIGPGSIGLLWSLSVAAEVGVFLLLGQHLLARLGVGGTCALATAAGLLRWSAMALDVPVVLLVAMQALHGLTFAAQHMAAMAMLPRLAPDRLGATAQALLASLGTGLFTATLLAALCALAIPLALQLDPATPNR